MGEGITVRGYVVERLLGRGASGEVWLARAAVSGARVALKRIAAPDDEARQRAVAEAALLRTLDHPNVVRLHAVVPAADAVVLVLDLAEGGSLADLLAARDRLSPGEVITAVAPVAAALAYLHEAGIVHGDVSAGNVLFTAGGAPLLADVGVARLRGEQDVAQATPAYVDPTVAAGHLPGPPSDVFMLAGVALHALTGAPPWPGEPTAALEHAARGDLADVAERLSAASVPAPMAEVLQRALDPDPARRGTAADLALDLRHSGRPVAVDLAAGRARPEPERAGPRHAARESTGVAGDPARPAFARPHDRPDGPEPPTRVVGARPRPVIPRPPRRPPHARRLAGVVAGVAIAVAAAGGIAWATAGRSADRPAQSRAEVETSRPSSGRPASGVPASGHPSFGSRATEPRSAGPRAIGPRISDPAHSTRAAAPANPWARALVALDAERGRAFATRDATVLRDVYASAGLVAADAGLLRQLVPAGCGLVGVRSRYSQIVVESAGDRATVYVTATLPPSQLTCHGQVRATAPGAGPSRLRVVLVSTPAGPRIAEQALVSG